MRIKNITLIITSITIFILFSFSHVFAQCYSIQTATSKGSCFNLVLKGKQDCKGKMRVGFHDQKTQSGYWLNDSYSMLKGKTHGSSGCYDAKRAITPSPLLDYRPDKRLLTSSASKNFIVIELDGKLEKTFYW